MYQEVKSKTGLVLPMTYILVGAAAADTDNNFRVKNAKKKTGKGTGSEGKPAKEVPLTSDQNLGICAEEGRRKMCQVTQKEKHFARCGGTHLNF